MGSGADLVTILGTDISSFQHGLNLASLKNASFVFAKCSEGTYYTDADYAGWRSQASALGKPFAWYHFLSGEDSAAQARHTVACCGDPRLPGMLDAEPEGSFKPSLSQILDYVDAAHAAGLNLRLVYLPRWYWQQIGLPDLTGLAARGVHLVSSSYPSASSGTPLGLYPGDSAAGWQPYGGVTPLIYQYTSQGADGGQYLDYNAFKGTVEQLAAVLNGTIPTPTPTPGGSTVPTIPASIAQQIPDVAKDFPPGGSYTDDVGIIWADARADAAMLYARQARDAVNALAAKVSGAAIDVAALAAQLGPLLHPTTDVNALAAALAPHVGAPDAVAFAAALAPHIKVTSA